MSTELESKIEYFKKWQEKMLVMERELKNEASKYQAEMKATFGLADGEKANILELVAAIQKVIAFK